MQARFDHQLLALKCFVQSHVGNPHRLPERKRAAHEALANPIDSHDAPPGGFHEPPDVRAVDAPHFLAAKLLLMRVIAVERAVVPAHRFADRANDFRHDVAQVFGFRKHARDRVLHRQTSFDSLAVADIDDRADQSRNPAARADTGRLADDRIVPRTVDGGNHVLVHLEARSLPQCFVRRIESSRDRAFARPQLCRRLADDRTALQAKERFPRAVHHAVAAIGALEIDGLRQRFEHHAGNASRLARDQVLNQPGKRRCDAQSHEQQLRRVLAPHVDGDRNARGQCHAHKQNDERRCEVLIAREPCPGCVDHCVRPFVFVPR
jgi:hypothetical protein